MVNSSYRTVDIQLGAASTMSDDKEFSIKAKTLVNRIRILAGVDETIEDVGVKNYTIGTEGDTIDIRLVGTNWEIK
jgi:hypothetical protein